jgi:hypothetical protein
MSKVISFLDERNSRVEKKRRNFERVLFKNFLGSYSVIDAAGSIYKIEMVDISETGCLFQIPWNVEGQSKFKKGEEVKFRMYFTQTSYLPVIVNIKYSKETVENDGQKYLQYGCEFDTSLNTYDALKSFIEFLYKFADLSVEDKGDSNQIFFL